MAAPWAKALESLLPLRTLCDLRICLKVVKKVGHSQVLGAGKATNLLSKSGLRVYCRPWTKEAVSTVPDVLL